MSFQTPIGGAHGLDGSNFERRENLWRLYWGATNRIEYSEGDRETPFSGPATLCGDKHAKNNIILLAAFFINTTQKSAGIYYCARRDNKY